MESKKKITKKSMVISSLALAFSLVMLFSASYAWFSSDVFEETGSINTVIDTGGLNLNCSLYIGNDFNLDGVLDEVTDNSGNDMTLLTRTNKLMQYREASCSEETIINNCTPGSIITYKLIVENLNDYDLKININFSDFGSYFNRTYTGLYVDDNSVIDFSQSSVSESEFNNIIGNNSAAMMFRLNDIKVNEYDNSLNNDFCHLSNEMVVTPSQYQLWELSNQTPFVDNITIHAGNLAEIDFKLSCMQLTEIVSGYTNYRENEISSLTTEEQKKARAMYLEELSYVSNININDSTSLPLKFTLNYLSIRGEQLGN